MTICDAEIVGRESTLLQTAEKDNNNICFLTELNNEAPPPWIQHDLFMLSRARGSKAAD